MILTTLRKPDSFRAVMNQGQKWITRGFIVFLAPQSVVSETGCDDCVLLTGVVASKKVGNAVKRNRAKRRLRHVIGLTQETHKRQGQCLVLVARQEALTLPFAQLQKDIRWALRKITGTPKSQQSV